MFQALSSNSYAVAVVKDSFIGGNSNNWNLDAAKSRAGDDPGWNEGRVNPDHINHTDVVEHLQHVAAGYIEKNVSDCFALYDDYWNPQGNVVITVKNSTLKDEEDDSLLLYVYVVPRWDDWGKNLWALGNGTQLFVAQSSSPHPVTTWVLGPPRYQVAGCRVQDPSSMTKSCRFQYSPPILQMVCLMNFIKAAAILWIWIKARRAASKEAGPADSKALFTLGDAIASFMREPDKNTVNMCLAEKSDFERRRQPWYSLRTVPPPPVDQPRVFRRSPRRWAGAASVRRWFILIFM